MRSLVERAQKGVASRQDWSNLAALSLVWQGDVVVTRIAAGGYEHFLQTCKPVYDIHHFGEDDYQRMYTRVCSAAARYERDVVH